MRLASFFALTAAASFAADKPIPPVPDKQPEPPFPVEVKKEPFMLMPGFIVRELPVQLTSLNNIEYAPDGRLFAGGYDGRFHLLRDTDGDGLEDKVDTFEPQDGPNYPLGMVVRDGDPCVVLTDEIVRYRDTNGDGIPDKRETIAKGFDDPELVAAKYLSHRRVDSSMALACGPDGAWYVTMGDAGYNNPYWHDGFRKGPGEPKQEGQPRYSTTQRRGCLLRITPDGKVEQLNSGLRYIMSLQFNKHGDLFASEQEGATWCPNGNPFDELLHLQPGRHYGFPPRHPTFLPNVADEPSVWDYAPQHESACGFRFNTPGKGRGLFGPAFWEDNAIVTGESRGVLWRTTVAKAAAGYVARNDLFARLNLLATDCAISPQGDLLVSCHTGKPDWGNGPKGPGRLLKFTFTDKAAPQPVLTWPVSETETVVAFDKATSSMDAARINLRSGRYLSAGDSKESMRPPYAVVQMQQRQVKNTIAVKSARLSDDARELHITSATRDLALMHELNVGNLGLAFDLSGLLAEWKGDGAWSGWLPHPDLTAAREFTKGSATHDALWKHLAQPGQLTLRTQLDLWNMMQPPTQPLSTLDYTPEPEVVTLIFKSDSALTLDARDAIITRVSDNESHLTVDGPKANHWPALTITVKTPATKLDIAFTTKRDAHVRAPGVKRFLVPFAKPGPPDKVNLAIPELAGGNFKNGHDLFVGKAACFTCHRLRNEGQNVGPDLSNLAQRDYAAVLRDITDPNAVINPDAVGYIVTTKDGKTVTGVRIGETVSELSIAQPGGAVEKIAKSNIAKTEPMKTSLMPAGLDKLLTKEELRDLITYLMRK